MSKKRDLFNFKKSWHQPEVVWIEWTWKDGDRYMRLQRPMSSYNADTFPIRDDNLWQFVIKRLV